MENAKDPIKLIREERDKILREIARLKDQEGALEHLLSKEHHIEELKLIDRTVSNLNDLADKRDWRAVHSRLKAFRNHIKSVLDKHAD